MSEHVRGEIRVWDPFVRIFHWLLVAGFATAYLSGDDFPGLHVWGGYLVAALLVLRLIWGVAGPRRARFTDFVYRPHAVIAYLRDLVRFRARRYLGHSPAGGAMVIALLLSLTATAGTGLVLYGAREHAGSLAAVYAAPSSQQDAAARRRETRTLKEAHEFLANLTLALVVVHVGGVLLASVAHRENLVRAMITGRKPAETTHMVTAGEPQTG
jgi:cytochrome b